MRNRQLCKQEEFVVYEVDKGMFGVEQQLGKTSQPFGVYPVN